MDTFDVDVATCVEKWIMDVLEKLKHTNKYVIKLPIKELEELVHITQNLMMNSASLDLIEKEAKGEETSSL